MERQKIEEILRDIYSKEDIYLLAEDASTNMETVKHLWDITVEMPFKKAWRASWVLDHASDRNVKILELFIDEVYNRFPNETNESLIRHYLKFLLKSPINVDKGLPVLDKCIELMNDPSAKIAGRGWGLQFFYEFAKIYPDMKYELLNVIDDLRDKEPSAGMIVFMRRIENDVKTWPDEE